ncbi:cell wall anchored protein [Phlyctema vagabunda]|uniref:Cell wall anchored protein n=1 Tax=Phlyctema vagabunda TaxID=108571 RepID=A0ABR4PXA4_9HELO
MTWPCSYRSSIDAVVVCYLLSVSLIRYIFTMSSFSHTLADAQRSRTAAVRPSFTSQKTSDRLREGERRSSTATPKVKSFRRSIFREELDLDSSGHSITEFNTKPRETTTTPRELQEPAEKVVLTTKPTNASIAASVEPRRTAEKITFDEILKDLDHTNASNLPEKQGNLWFSLMSKNTRPTIRTASSAPPSSFSTMHRVALIAFLIALVVPGLLPGKDNSNVGTADAGVIPVANLVDNGSLIQSRQSATDVCTRWTQQTAIVNGTMYMYGGRAKTSSTQTSDTWNNDFLTLDLTKSWQISSPSVSGLPQPSGPPAVSMGYLWHSYDSLFLYGGEFSDNPSQSPVPVSTWEYDLKSSTWIEHSSPQTSAGNFSDGGGKAVQRSAEGAGLSIPELGKSYYFGGHLDLYTTPGWSNQIARVYLKSLLEFTHPGYINTGVDSLGTTAAAGDGGVYRNITEGGLQDDAAFTERADGVLVYIPGWADEGMIIGLAGGTNTTFTEMNIIDIYDISTSTWYKQSTSGESPPIRVNPCAVVAAAADGSSFNVYLYGGQNLIPFGEQIQYDDMWILTIPSFTWIQVDLDGQSQPPARAGHTCNLWDSQMIVVGGYVGTDISCDSPGVYVFNTSSLQWTNSFTPSSESLTGGSFSEVDQGSDILRGSVGYEVPAAVQSIIGGSAEGGASATTPAAGSATVGPLATGRPPTFTVTQSGQTVTHTGTQSTATATTTPNSPNTSQASKKQGPNIGAIVAGTIAGVLAILAGYLAFCSWLYRKQLRMYKNHVAMAQRTAFNQSPDASNWNPSDESGGRVTEKPVLGAFGTDLRASGSAGRPSYGSSGRPTGAPMNTGGNESGGESSLGHSSGGGYGGGSMPGGGTAGVGYGRLSEEDEGTGYHGAGGTAMGHTNWGRPSVSSATSSVEDLLGGQEPSFFSVVLNPRRTLKVVNLD